jgi:phosphoribosylpyrophosphate synthetase
LYTRQIKIFAGSSSIDFVTRMCRYLNIQSGKSETFHFPDGNIYVKILENVRNKDVYLVQTIGLNANDSFVELLFWIDSFKRSSASSVTVIMPFFSYAKADKKDEPRVSIRARVCADCIEAANVVKQNGANRVFAMVTHALLDEKGIKALENSPIEKLITTDTVNNQAVLNCSKIKTISVAPLMAEAVRIIQNKGSLSSLFDHPPKNTVKSCF